MTLSLYPSLGVHLDCQIHQSVQVQVQITHRQRILNPLRECVEKFAKESLLVPASSSHQGTKAYQIV